MCKRNGFKPHHEKMAISFVPIKKTRFYFNSKDTATYDVHFVNGDVMSNSFAPKTITQACTFGF